MISARCCLLLSLLLLTLPARAQDDQKAGLFTQARQLPLVSQSLYVEARGEDAEVRLIQVFHNDGPELGQADYQLHLPEGATVMSFGFWQGERFLSAELKEKGEAEAAHQQAAAEGRATAILKTDAGVQRFSVYPVGAGAMQRVEVTLRVPVAREMGRSQVALAVDRFLGQGRALSTVVVDVQAEEPLADVGVEGARFTQLGRSERSTRLLFSADKPVEVWWSERGAPLSYGADAVKLEDGSSAVALRISLNDAGAWRAPYKEVRLYVDASFSMRRRRAALEALVDRLQDQSSAPVRVFAVGSTVREQRMTGDAAAVVKALLDGTVGHTTHGATFARAMEASDCRAPEVRCVGVTDLQLAGFDQILPLLPSFLFLADAHERAYKEGEAPLSARVFDPEVEAMAKLRAMADELVLPVLEVTALSQEGRGVEPMGSAGRRVAEGGLLRLFFRSTSEAPLDVAAHIDGRQVGQQVRVTPRSPESPEGKAVRRGYFERQLATWMAAYKRSPDAELKQRIIETSLKEGIPTAFTALQVSSPELSLDAIKPGDPLLTARVEPGLEEVTAWYPFGEARRLVYDAREGVFVDRFLVPRGWTDRLYAVEVFKRYADGRVRQERAWYRLDDAGPAVSVEADTERGVLRIASAEAGQDLGGVRLEGASGWTRTLSALAGEWMMPLAELPPAFTVVARDRAGNTVHLAFTWERGTLSAMDEGEAAGVVSRSALVPEVLGLWVEGQGLRLAGEEVRLTVSGRELRFAHAEAPLTSLTLTAVLPLDGGVLFGTQGGELVHLSCPSGMERCTARAVGTFPSHPVTGLVKLSEGVVLVGVLGEGLKELRGEKLERSRLDVGSMYVTGLASDGRDVLVGTAYNGLWRVTGGRAVRTRFPHPHVLSLSPAAGGVEVASGSGRFLQKGRDRYVALPPLSLPSGSRAMMAAALFEGEVYLGGFDSGLWRWVGGKAEPVPLELGVREAQVNALAVHEGALWMGTEAGLLRLSRSGKGLRVERIHEASVHDLAVGAEGLAAATSRGLLVVREGLRVRRVDLQSGVDTGKFFAVAWQGRTLWAGGMDGLYRFEDGRGEQLGAAEGYRGGWVTALLPRGDAVWVGTYASGVYAVREGRASRVQGLEGQWVPLRALKAVGDEVWVGGLGMPSVRVGEDGRKRAVHLPTRDVNDVLAIQGGTLLLTTDGAMLLRASMVGALTPMER